MSINRQIIWKDELIDELLDGYTFLIDLDTFIKQKWNNEYLKRKIDNYK